MNYLFLEEENRTYNDMVSVGGPECTKLSTVVKTRRWFEYALKFNTAWIAKTDDDVVWNPQKFYAEINIMHVSPPKSLFGFPECPLGHFLYVDGVFETISRDLVEHTLTTPLARTMMENAMRNYQEDTSIGSIIYEESIK